MADARAITFKRDISWQSNRSSCGPASIANAFRSLGEEAITEPEVLAGTGRCWLLGFCIPGLTLDELADVARVHSTRGVTVLRDLTEDAFRTLLREATIRRDATLSILAVTGSLVQGAVTIRRSEVTSRTKI